MTQCSTVELKRISVCTYKSADLLPSGHMFSQCWCCSPSPPHSIPSFGVLLSPPVEGDLTHFLDLLCSPFSPHGTAQGSQSSQGVLEWFGLLSTSFLTVLLRTTAVLDNAKTRIRLNILSERWRRREKRRVKESRNFRAKYQRTLPVFNIVRV